MLQCRRLMKTSVFLMFLSVFIGANILFAPFLGLSAQSQNDPFFNEQWYLDKISVPIAWQETIGSTDVIVAILDAGFDLDHEDLVNQYWKNKNEIPNNKKDDDGNGYEDDAVGWDFVDSDPDPSPVINAQFNDTIVSHGTAIAGIIGASTNNGIGISGINQKISIMPLRILNEKGVGSSLDVREAIEYAVKNGAQIINLSFTTDLPDAKLGEKIAWAVDQGVVIVAAVGNEDRDINSKPSFPACYDSFLGREVVIGVSASDKNDLKANFSNYGETCTDLSAPGTNIFSSVYHDPSNLLTSTAYGSPWEGTSIAAPIVSAAAALLKSAFPSLTPEQIRLSFKLSVDPVKETALEARKRLGAGRLNVARAVEYAKVFAKGQGTQVTNKNTNHSRSLVIAEGPGSEPSVSRVNAHDEEFVSFLAYNENFRGGISLAMADVTGDGKEEIITGARKGGGPQVRIFDLNGNLLSQFFAYDPSDRGGIFVSSGDVNSDGIAEIFVLSESGGIGDVRMFNHYGQLKGLIRPFGLVDNPIRLTIANMDEDAENELIFLLMDDDGSMIRIVDGDGRYVRQFSLSKNTKWQSLSSADTDGDGENEIVISASSKQIPIVETYSAEGDRETFFVSYDPRFNGGVNVCAGDIDQNGRAEIYTVPFSNGGPHVRIFEKNGVAIGGFFAFEKEHRLGAICAIW
ncbi:S8 family serine peptidase [Candidatus Uhrbacteria bacterium]|nr:S8 family serine peptidase [Candidatus Uhrbacteria bacterium]